MGADGGIGGFGVIAPERAPHQPPLLDAPDLELHAAIGSLALGGAERILLQWAVHASRRHSVHLVVLRDCAQEWPVPLGVAVTRLHGAGVSALQGIGSRCAAGGNPVVLCHLLNRAERDALRRGGALAVPVLHNAAAGWIEPAHRLDDASHVIAVSAAAVRDLRAAGCTMSALVVPQLPRAAVADPDARATWRMRWALPPQALVIGMIGGVKPQKAYPRALRVLAVLCEHCPAYLVILGGPVGRDGVLAWNAVLAQARRLRVEDRVRLPGFILQAQHCLPAFDLLLNTSRHEGLSIATLEALAAGLPVVASHVGGQGEIAAPGLHLLALDAPDHLWAKQVVMHAGTLPPRPDWLGFPSERLWTLCHIARAVQPCGGVLFVTANLNAGGAQRSLVNLALALGRRIEFGIAVCGNSSAAHFIEVLAAAGCRVHRSGDSRDCFDHAEALLRHVLAVRPSVLCFWNVDPKVKLLLAKVLGVTRIGLVDVSPGAYAFEEMRATTSFQQWTAYSEAQYCARLSRLVLKYQGSGPAGINVRTTVIRNGVPVPAVMAAIHGDPLRRIVVSGRIAPSKHLLAMVEAMRQVWLRYPDASLHILGVAEPRHRRYADEVVAAAGSELGQRIMLHGAEFDAPVRLGAYHLALVLGEHQGCPNAVLEAMAAGLPVIANDSGGTRELVVDGRTGVLVDTPAPAAIAAGLLRLMSNPPLARRLAAAGRGHVEREFSMAAMADAYVKLFEEVSREHASC